MDTHPPQRASTRPQVVAALVLTLLGLFGYATQRQAPFFEALEGSTLDWRFRLRGPMKPSGKVVTVSIDDRSIAALGGWPLDRKTLAAAIDALSRAGAKVIALDLLLTERGRKPGQPPDSAADRALAEAIQRAGRVIVAYGFVFDRAHQIGNQSVIAIAPTAFTRYRIPPRGGPDLLVDPIGLAMPRAILLRAGHPAHVSVVLDSDGALRRAQPVIGFGDAFYPSLAVEAARLWMDLKRSAVTLLFGDAIILGTHRIGTDRHMRVAVNYYGPEGTFPRYPLADLLAGKVSSNAFSGRVVVVGVSAIGLSDRFVTPFSRTLPGYEHFATHIDNILTGRSLARAEWTVLVDLAALILLGLLGALIGRIQRPLYATGTTLLTVGLWGLVALGAFAWARAWLNFTFPLMTFAMVTGVVAVQRHYAERLLRRTAERERGALSRFVSPLATDRALATGANVADERTIEATIMFVDLRGFTQMSEGMTPEDNMRFLRRYHRLVERAAGQHNGMVDKYLGDGAIVTFGTSAGDAGSPRDAVACARALLANIAEWNQERANEGTPPLAIGVGLHHGPVTVGVAGGERHAEVTVTGDTVNVASRLEALTKEHGAVIIASDAVIRDLAASGADALAAGFEALGDQPIRGRAKPLAVWALRRSAG